MATATAWVFTATTAHRKVITHTATSRDKARKLRDRVSRLPFVTGTSAPAKAV